MVIRSTAVPQRNRGRTSRHQESQIGVLTLEDSQSNRHEEPQADLSANRNTEGETLEVPQAVRHEEPRTNVAVIGISQLWTLLRSELGISEGGAKQKLAGCAGAFSAQVQNAQPQTDMPHQDRGQVTHNEGPAHRETREVPQTGQHDDPRTNMEALVSLNRDIRTTLGQNQTSCVREHRKMYITTAICINIPCT